MTYCGKIWNQNFSGCHKALKNGRKKLRNLKWCGIFQIVWVLWMASTAISLLHPNQDLSGFATRNIFPWFWWPLQMHFVDSHGSTSEQKGVHQILLFSNVHHLVNKSSMANYLSHHQEKFTQNLTMNFHTAWLVMRPSLEKWTWSNLILVQGVTNCPVIDEFSITDSVVQDAQLKVHLVCWQQDSDFWNELLSYNLKATKRSWKQQLCCTTTLWKMWEALPWKRKNCLKCTTKALSTSASLLKCNQWRNMAFDHHKRREMYDHNYVCTSTLWVPSQIKGTQQALQMSSMMMSNKLSGCHKALNNGRKKETTEKKSDRQSPQHQRSEDRQTIKRRNETFLDMQHTKTKMNLVSYLFALKIDRQLKGGMRLFWMCSTQKQKWTSRPICLHWR